MRRDQYIELHRELWNWLYHHPNSGKEDWPEWEFNEGKIPSMPYDCFPCEFSKNVCPNCLFEWGNDISCIDKKFIDDKGYYSRWVSAKSPKTRKKYARIIRDLSVRGD